MNTVHYIAIGVGALALLAGGAVAAEQSPPPGDGTPDPVAPAPQAADAPNVVAFIQAMHYRPGPRTIDRIVLHITDGQGKAKATAEYFASGAEGRQVSAHYVVGQNGEIYQCVRDQDIAFHAHSANQSSIGIEHNARTVGELKHSDPGLPMSDAQYAASVRLVAWLCSTYSIPADRAHIQGHNEADPATSHTSCPTGQLDWGRYMTELSQVGA